MKIFFKGYYGFENLGDDIFVHTIKWFCQKKDIDYYLHGFKLPYGVNGKKTKNKIQKNIYDLIYSFKASNIIYWGGSTFERISNKKDLKFYLNKMKFLRDKVSLFSVSLGPFSNKDEEKKVVNFVGKVKYAGVRDLKSLDYEVNANFTFDLAILAPIIFENIVLDNGNKKKNIVVNISESRNYQEYTDIYFTFLQKNKMDIENVSVLVFNPKDYKKSMEFYERLRKEKINSSIHNYSRDTKSMVDVIAASDLLLGNRLHSGILAYAYNIPFVLNEYHLKCTDFLNTINQDFRVGDIKKSSFDMKSIISDCKERKDPQFFKGIMINELNKLMETIEK